MGLLEILSGFLADDSKSDEASEPVERVNNAGHPTPYYPCYPPWKEEETFRKTNTRTDFGPNYGGQESDWKSRIEMERGGTIHIWWDGMR